MSLRWYSRIFAISATGAPPLAYQWQRSESANGSLKWVDISDNNDYSGSATGKLSVSSGFLYRCVVTNAIGSATSNSAALFGWSDPGGGDNCTCLSSRSGSSGGAPSLWWLAALVVLVALRAKKEWSAASH